MRSISRFILAFTLLAIASLFAPSTARGQTPSTVVQVVNVSACSITLDVLQGGQRTKTFHLDTDGTTTTRLALNPDQAVTARVRARNCADSRSYTIEGSVMPSGLVLIRVGPHEVESTISTRNVE